MKKFLSKVWKEFVCVVKAYILTELFSGIMMGPMVQTEWFEKHLSFLYFAENAETVAVLLGFVVLIPCWIFFGICLGAFRHLAYEK